MYICLSCVFFGLTFLKPEKSAEPLESSGESSNRKKQPRRSQRIAEKESPPKRRMKEDVVHIPFRDHRSQPSIRMAIGRDDHSGILASIFNNIIFRRTAPINNGIGASPATPIDLTQGSDDSFDVVEIPDSDNDEDDGRMIFSTSFFPLFFSTITSPSPNNRNSRHTAELQRRNNRRGNNESNNNSETQRTRYRSR